MDVSGKLIQGLLVSAALCGNGLDAEAANSAWTADADGNWSDAGNWDAGVPGSTVATDSPDVAAFATTLTAGRTVTVDASRNIGGITFGCTNGWAYMLGGAQLLLSNGGVIQNASDNGVHTDVVDVAVSIQGDGGAATFCANALLPDSTLMIKGNVSGTATAGKTNTLTLTGTSTNSGFNIVSGSIGDGSGGGKLSLVKSGGTNAWTLSGANTFSGSLSLQQGTLIAAHSSALSSVSGVAVPAKCRLGLQGGVTIAGKTLSLDGGASTATSDNGLLLNVGGTNTWTGNVTMSGSTPRFNSDAGKLIVSGNVNMGTALANNFTLGGNGDGEISGVVSGTEILFRSSADTGTWYLTGQNTYTSSVTVGNGTLAINTARSLGYARTAFSATAVTLGGSTRRGTLRAIEDIVLSDKYGITLHNMGGLINVDSGRTFTVNGVISDRTSAPYGGPLTKSGLGTLVLNAVNTFSNTFEVAEGKAVIGKSNALGGKSGNPAKLKVDATLDLGGFSVTNPILTGAGGVVTNGTLRVTLETSVGGAGTGSVLTLPDVTLQGVLTADVASDGSSDRLNIVGSLALDNLALNIVDSGKLNQSQTYTLAACTGGSVVGRFSSHNLPENWWIDYSGGRVQLKYFTGMVLGIR